MVQKNAQKEYEKLSAQVNDLQNQVNDNQINIPSDTQTETENVAQEVQTEDSELPRISNSLNDNIGLQAAISYP